MTRGTAVSEEQLAGGVAVANSSGLRRECKSDPV